MSKPRLLVTLTIQFGVRYLLRTGLLGRLGEHAEPVVLMSWEDRELRAELDTMGIEVHQIPPPRHGGEYKRVRRYLDTWFAQQLSSPTAPINYRITHIDAPLRRRAISRAREIRNSVAVRVPLVAQYLRAQEQRLLRTDTNFDEVARFVRELRADALLSLTPFHVQEELVARAAAAERMKLCAAILSFDNLTVRGWMPTTFDLYLLWNRYNVAELHRGYPETKDKRVVIVGAPQFDFYRNPSYRWDERTWRTHVGLPADRPIILYGGGPTILVPNEPDLVAQLDDAIERGQISDKPLILLRRHPADTDARWRDLRARAKHLVFDVPWKSGDVPKYSNIRDLDIAKLVSSLEHSAVHVSVSSTMSLDGAVFDRPQVCPAYDDRPPRRYDRMVRELYLREHYLPITNSGGVAIAYDRRAMAHEVDDGFETPGRRAAGRRKMLEEIITFTDGRSTERVLDELARFV